MARKTLYSYFLCMRNNKQVSVKNKYKHLELGKRSQIKALRDHGFKQQEIAGYTGYSQSTVSRELSRNMTEDRRGNQVYKPEKAQLLYEDRRTKANLRHNFYIKHVLLSGLLIKLLKKGHSPDVIANRILKEETEYRLSTSTIYNYIRNKKPALRRELLFKHGYKKHTGEKKQGQICPNLPRIHERPDSINNRENDGDREADSVVSGGPVGGATTLTNRKHRFLLLRKAQRLTGEVALYNMIGMLEGHDVNSVTSDNGGEFCHLDIVGLRLEITCYLCHPYSSREKGSNEKNNREIRYYIPKGANFDDYTDEQLQEIQDKINKKPRKILGYKSAYESYYGVSLTYL